MKNRPKQELNLKYVEKLLLSGPPYLIYSELEKDFILAMKEVIEHHRTSCLFYQKFLELKKFNIDDLKSFDDLEKIPPIHANFFKEKEILSIKKEDVYVHLTSSGTTGQKSQIYFDQWSLKSAQFVLDEIFDFYNWYSDQKTNYLLYTYETKRDDKLGTAYTDNYLCQYAPIQNVFCALRLSGLDGHKFDLFGTIDTLCRYEKENYPVRIFGFPAFFYFTLTKMKEMGMAPLKLHPDSLVFLGGGWKGHQNESISKNDLYQLANEYLGIQDDRLRDGFGSVEHCIPYVECSHHQFHIPVCSRIIIRDVKTLKPLSEGNIGYLNFISPYITSAPANSVLMGDLASWYSGSKCPCDIETSYFVLYGRAGVSKGKSCALAAVEILEKW